MTASRAAPVRLGAVEYLNARPLVYGLESSSTFDLRFDVPSRCADLLHAGTIDLGLIPSIEYLRGAATGYRAVPGLAIGSKGPVASVMLYTTKAIADVRSIALDVSSRASVALVRVLCARQFRIAPALRTLGPDPTSMLAESDAALVIGDTALFLEEAALARIAADVSRIRSPRGPQVTIEAIDLGQVWSEATGLPFVYAFWAGRPGALTPEQVVALQAAGASGVARRAEVARGYFRHRPERWTVGERYLRDNIRYSFGDDERAGLELFYQYSAEAGVVESAGTVQFYDADAGVATR